MMRGFKAQQQHFTDMGTRDDRANLVDDDPFSRPQKARIHRIHQRQGNDGTIHFDTNSGNIGGMLNQLLSGLQQKPATMHDGRIWHFSKTERSHLAFAMGAFTLALGLMRVRGNIFYITRGINSMGYRFATGYAGNVLGDRPGFLITRNRSQNSSQKEWLLGGV